MNTSLSHLALMPGLVILSLSILFFFIGKTIPAVRRSSPVGILASMMVLAILMELRIGVKTETLFSGMIQLDAYAHACTLMILFCGLAMSVMMSISTEMRRSVAWEHCGFIATMLLGAILMAMARNLLFIAVAIELVSIPSYLLVASHGRDTRSREAGLKYLLFGAFSTAVMLYGMSLLFGFSGQLDLQALGTYLLAHATMTNPVLFIALAATLGGILFKLSAVPFHFWCPDAYQAAPTPVTGFLSVVPKLAGFALLLRACSFAFDQEVPTLTLLLMTVSIATMFLGNLAALRQSSVKRLLAYSSISHAGFMLMGVTILNTVAGQFVFFYLVIYVLMNLGAFLSLILLCDSCGDEERHLRGKINTQPLIVICFSVFLFSLAGIPPFAGFIGKFYLIKIAIDNNFIGLAVAAGVNSLIALYYYVKIIRIMIIDKADPADMAEVSFGHIFVKTLLSINALALVVLGLYWQPLLDKIEHLVLVL